MEQYHASNPRSVTYFAFRGGKIWDTFASQVSASEWQLWVNHVVSAMSATCLLYP